MPRYIPMCFLLSLALGGCEAASGALASLGIQAITVAGQGVTRNIERDIDAGLRWTGAHDAWAAGAMAEGDIGDWDKADKAFQDCLDRHVEHMPYTLAGRIAKRVERIKGPATSVPAGDDTAVPPPE